MEAHKIAHLVNGRGCFAMANAYKIKYKSGSSYVVYCPFPINSVYLNWGTTNPNVYWPGTTWTRISEGRYLVASGTNYTVGNSYGANSVTLTVAQMPSHNHTVTYGNSLGASGIVCAASSTLGTGSGAFINNTGGGQSHENRPLSYAVSMWRRTA